jgi:uncharacterized membrane protein YgdD (TMEM256/DUF423 family)
MNAARAGAAIGVLACGASVALSAMAAHFHGDALDRQRLALAAAMAFGHGLALVAIAARASRLAALARLGFVAGIVLFCGSLLGAAWCDWPTTAAPAGGVALMLAWAILAADFLRRE